MKAVKVIKNYQDVTKKS